MDKTLLNGTVTTAVVRAGEAGTAIGRRVADTVGSVNWQQLVPEARKMLDVGGKLVLARQGVRAVADTTRRHPVASAAVAAALAGLGVAVWLTRRRARTQVIEAEAAPAKKRPARKAAKKPAAKKTAAKKTAARKRAPAKKAATNSSAAASAN